MLELLQETKKIVNEGLCPYYRSIWNNCEKLRGRHLIHQYYTISGTGCVKFEESSFPKSITHMVDLEQLFQEVDTESLLGIT